MSDYLGSLIARTLRPADSIRPRLGSQFEPSPFAAVVLPREDTEAPAFTHSFATPERLASTADAADPSTISAAPVASPSRPPAPALGRAEPEARAVGPPSPPTTPPADTESTISVRARRPIPGEAGTARRAEPEPERGNTRPSLQPRLVHPETPQQPPPASADLEAAQNLEPWPPRSEVAREAAPRAPEPIAPVASRMYPGPSDGSDAPVRPEMPARQASVPAIRPAAVATPPPREAGVRSRSDAPEPPMIRVTIGRVEVRAVSPPSRPAPKPVELRRPLLSLDDYLERRNAGRL